MNTQEAKIVIETALLCSQQPMSISELRRLFDEEIAADTLRALLEELRQDWQGRGLQLATLASGWRFQSTPQMAPYLERLNPEKPPRYSRALMETLAIIAYRQPVTRGDIEEIRGVTVSSQLVKTLEERGWVEVIGHKDVLGRPELLGTTRQFLDDLGLRSLGELPPLLEPGQTPGAAEAIAQRVIEFAGDEGQEALLQPDEAALAQPVSVDAMVEAATGPEAVAAIDPGAVESTAAEAGFLADRAESQAAEAELVVEAEATAEGAAAAPQQDAAAAARFSDDELADEGDSPERAGLAGASDQA
ncbi:MAG: SMC-Scp complex subunit ScpB [Burkholderiaceae bacterium]|nr:SMC-Scp complex subunit ScpB [Burkholderiaceae bacterium]